MIKFKEHDGLIFKMLSKFLLKRFDTIKFKVQIICTFFIKIGYNSIILNNKRFK